ncbi:MAG: glutamate--tRNA ligase [Bordetella sp.]|nr:MAG: glutamate--tRNA ligase [Bordetella sp.]
MKFNSFNQIKTRFAPSPTGPLHLGSIRTALFSWAFARHYNGRFILRIEDTDIERSSKKSLQSILDTINWLGLKPDEGPFYQTNRLLYYKKIITEMMKNGSAYYCYSSPDDIENMRTIAKKHGLKPRYDGTWRPEVGKKLPKIPNNIKPVIRFKNPQTGILSWNDIVKGKISIQNSELDDLIIMRSDEMPTYNFCAAIDDWEMGITHVLRGDDHINNTPRQINILNSLNITPPNYGHIPMILNKEGEKLSKRHNVMSVMDYKEQGYLPDAIINYLSRLGWSHGNNEIFNKEQLIHWFDAKNFSKSPAHWDNKKLDWINSFYIKKMSDQSLYQTLDSFLTQQVKSLNFNNLFDTMLLFKNRVSTLKELAENIKMFSETFYPIISIDHKKYLTPFILNVLKNFNHDIQHINWNRESISNFIKITLGKYNIKMSEIAIPLRIILIGKIQTPPIEDILLLLGKKIIRDRLNVL